MERNFDYPDWRVEELANKYAPADAYWPDDVDEEEQEPEETEEDEE